MKTKLLLLLSLLSTSTYAYGGCNKCGHAHSHSHTHADHTHHHAPASTKSGFYVQGNVGAAFPANFDRNTYIKRAKSTSVFGGGVGYSVNKSLSTDILVNYRHKFKYSDSDGDSQNLSSTSMMLNGYYIIPAKTVSPYLAAGLGIAFHNVGNIYEALPVVFIKGARVNSFAWQVGAGVKFEASKNIVLDLGYRYVDLGSFKTSNQLVANDGIITTGDAVPGKLRTHEIAFGIAYKF